jgi:signal transduction histidine kinase
MDSTATRSSRPGNALESSVVESSADALDAAVRRIAELAGEEIATAAAAIGDPGVDFPECAEGQLPLQLLWVAQASADGEPDRRASGRDLTLRRRLVERLRTLLIERWSEAPVDEDRMLDALRRLERAQRACTPVTDQALSAELAGRGGFDLVVEIAHDMRSPLTSIQFLAEVLHAGHSGGLNDVQRRQVGIIYSAALGLAGMANDLMEMASGRNPYLAQQLAPFSISDVLHGVRDVVQPMAEEKGIELRVACASTGSRLGFPLALNRVLLNLTTNALKFTHSGSVEITSRTTDEGLDEFAVRDTGAGITEEALESLFQPFRRVANRDSGYRFSGTGLGLSICRQLVEGMGGTLQIETSPGTGTRFWFELRLPHAGPH